MESITKNHGAYRARVDWYDDDGKRYFKSKSGFKTKAEARRWCRITTTELEKTKGEIKADVAFNKYFDEWYSIYKKNKIADSTAPFYTSLSKAIKEEFGNRKLSKIRRSNYQKFINDYGSKHAKTTVKKVHSTIKAVVASAIYDGIIQKDFTHNIELVWSDKRTWKIDYLNAEEIQRVIDDCTSKLNRRYPSRYMILTAFYTGFRLSEIAALTWNDIDFTNRTIEVTKSYDYRKKDFKETKNASSQRIIKVTQSLLDCLEELKANNSKLVFKSQFGSVPTSNAVNKTLRKILVDCGINKPSYHFHSIRHSHVALLLYNQVDIYAISKRLGHSDITTTTRKYAYMLDELKSKSDDHIEQTLDNLNNKKSDN